MRSINESDFLTGDYIEKKLHNVCIRCLNSCIGKDSSIDKERATKLVTMFLRVINLYLKKEYLFNPTYVASSCIRDLTLEEESIRKELLDIILSIHKCTCSESDDIEKIRAILVVNELATTYADCFTDFTYPINKKIVS